jgi:hypothetical protein
MPYYTESASQELREKFEYVVLSWKGVRKKILFGSPSYAAGDTTFAMLVDGGIILTRLDDDQKSALISGNQAEYFVGHGRVMKKWVLIPIRDPAEIENFLPSISASYARASEEKDSGA